MYVRRTGMMLEKEVDSTTPAFSWNAWAGLAEAFPESVLLVQPMVLEMNLSIPGARMYVENQCIFLQVC